MADSFFVPQYQLNLVPEADRQGVADTARNNFLLGLFGTRKGFGAGLLAGNQMAQKSVLDYLDGQETARKMQAAQRELAARKLAVDLISQNSNPTFNTTDALSAPEAGPVGPTNARASLIGAPNPAAAIPIEQRYRTAALDPRIAMGAPDFAKTLATIANEAGPQYEFVNGVRVNKRSPTQNFIPKMSEGEEPVFDARGQIVGIRNMQGAISALSQRQDAQRSAEARYQFEQVYNPATGQREFVSREQMAGGRAPGARTGAPGAPGAVGGGGMVSDPGPLEGDIAKQVATTINEGRTKAESARNSLRLNAIVEPLLANAITGPLANQQLSVARVLAQAGFGEGTVADTETFALTKARGVLDLVKNLGAGVSISNADLRFAEQIAGKEITLNATTLKRLMQIENKLADQAITSHNKRVDQVFGSRPTLGGVGKDYFQVEPFKREQPANPPAGGAPRNPAGAPNAQNAWGIRKLP